MWEEKKIRILKHQRVYTLLWRWRDGKGQAGGEIEVLPVEA